MWIPANIPYKKLPETKFCRITKEPILSDKLICTNYCRYSWRKRWDSNPRALSDNRISSAARYDHFDTLPCAFAGNRTTRQRIALFLWRCHPDLNRGMKVLQTFALPLGYGTG